MMPLTSKFKQELKAKAHKLKPIVLMGNHGLSESVVKEIDRGLHDHELIKIRIPGSDREAKQAVFLEACELTHAEPIQLMGSVGIIYRKNPKKDPSKDENC